MKIIGNIIKSVRISKCLTKNDMALELNISVRTYNNIESCKTDITISKLKKIAELLSCDVSCLIENHVMPQAGKNQLPEGEIQHGIRAETDTLNEIREIRRLYTYLIVMEEKEINRLEHIIKKIKGL